MKRYGKKIIRDIARCQTPTNWAELDRKTRKPQAGHSWINAVHAQLTHYFKKKG